MSGGNIPGIGGGYSGGVGGGINSDPYSFAGNPPYRENSQGG